MDLLALHGTNPNRPEISALLTRFYENAACGLPEIERLATTVSTWWPEIHAAITTGVTNAGSEGTNRVIKTDPRCAYGYRNPANQRLRARAAGATSRPEPADATANPERTQVPDDNAK